MRRWRRAHKMLAGSIAAVVVATAAVLAVPVLVLADVLPAGAAGVAVVVPALLAAWAIRKAITGVYTGDDGILIRETLNTEAFAWTGIAAIEARTSSHETELGGPWSSLWIITDTGDALETNVIRGSYWVAPQPSLVGRRSPPDGLYLVEHIFDAVVKRLKTELAASGSPSRPARPARPARPD